MTIAAEIMKDSVVQCISYAQLHELILTVVFTAVAAAVTAWWTSSASTPTKSIPKVDDPSDVQKTEIVKEKQTPDTIEIIDMAEEQQPPETSHAKIAHTACADSADLKTPLCREHDGNADGLECQSGFGHTHSETAPVDLCHCPEEDGDHDDDSDVDVDSWRAVAGRFASVLSLADDADEDQSGEYAGSMLWSAHYASKYGLGGLGPHA